MSTSPREPWSTPELTELSVGLDTASGGGSNTDLAQQNPGKFF